MIKSYGNIMSEVGSACEYVWANGGSIPLDSVGEQIEWGKRFIEPPDNEHLEGWVGEELSEPSLNTVRAASVEEFVMIYEALAHIHGGLDQRKIDTDVYHETAHKAAADSVGFRHSVFQLTITESRISRLPTSRARFSWIPSSSQAGPLGSVTKLAFASILAAPHQLSAGDSACLTAMGYLGKEDIASRIANATDPSLSSLSLPL